MSLLSWEPPQVGALCTIKPCLACLCCWTPFREDAPKEDSATVRLLSCEGFSAVRSGRQPLWGGQHLGARSPGQMCLEVAGLGWPVPWGQGSWSGWMHLEVAGLGWPPPWGALREPQQNPGLSKPHCCDWPVQGVFLRTKVGKGFSEPSCVWTASPFL